MKRVIAVSLLLLSLSTAAPVSAAVGAGIKAGTLGIGPEVHYGINDMISVTVAGKYLPWSYDFTADGVDYEGDLKLMNLGLLANFHPGVSWLSGMRVTGGVFLNKNKIDLVAESYESVDLSAVGSLEGDVTFSAFSPYAGIGWGQVEGRRWGFAWDLGILYQGSPQVNLEAKGPVAMVPGINQELGALEDDAEEEIKLFKFYPVAQIGFYIRF